MAFRSANIAAHMIKFNSAASSDFLSFYDSIVQDEIISEQEKSTHRTFAPSQMRCDRVSWFRLRGTPTDLVKNPDKTLHFTAEIGTACHESIQRRLSQKLGADWLTAQQWIDMNPDLFSNYELSIETKGYESLIDLRSPYPVRFACDGILRFNNKIYLLEIKTSEFASLNDLTCPKAKHMDQIKCYSTLMHIPDVLVLYVDRHWGELKCFEETITLSEQQELRSKMDHVLDCVRTNIAPEGLPKYDPDCTRSMCKYFDKCKQW